MDEHVIRARLEKLEQSLRQLSELSQKSVEQVLKSWELKGLIERNLEVAAQACIDIASHIVSARGLAAPESYAGVFSTLASEGVLDEGLAKSMSDIAGLRNILVHDYLEIDHKLLHELLQDLSAFRAFAKAVVDSIWPASDDDSRP